ncbi:MAG: hypothetical protein ABL983_00160 [Nitrospira sp.]
MRTDTPTPLVLWVDSATIFTPQNPVIGWAYLLVHHDQEVAWASGTILPHIVAPLQAHGAALLAMKQGLRTCLALAHRQVTLCYDNLALFYWITGVWNSTHPLIQDVRDLIVAQDIDLTWHKVSPHSALPFHLAVDRLAQEAHKTALRTPSENMHT